MRLTHPTYFDIYAIKIKIDTEVFDIPVYAGDGVSSIH